MDMERDKMEEMYGLVLGIRAATDKAVAHLDELVAGLERMPVDTDATMPVYGPACQVRMDIQELRQAIEEIEQDIREVCA